MSITLPASLEIRLKSESLETGLKTVLEHFACQAGTYHSMRDGLLHLQCAVNIPPFVLDAIREVPVGKGIAGLAAQRLEPVSLCNLQTDASGQARPNAKATGMEGSLAVPALAPDGVLRGVLGIAKASAHDWTEEEKEGVRAAAALLSASC